jgi:predicted NACHT family NTPase
MAGTPRSYKLSLDGKRQVEHALTDKAWSTEDLADAISVGRATATKFRAGRQRVDRQNFVNFCKALGLDWATVAEPESPPAKKTENLIQDLTAAERHLFNRLQLEWGVKHDKLTQLRENLKTEKEDYVRRQLEEEIRMEEMELRELAERLHTLIKQHCREEILQNYSKIRLLNGQETEVDQLYVDVWLLGRQPRTFQLSESKMLESFDLRNDRLGLGDQIQRNPGFEIANRESKLLILGKPGAGKTTFLKHLAIDWCNSKFQVALIAVFIEFRQIRDENWKLLNTIGEEIKIHDERQVKALLNDGKLLVLMDGFDEVPTQELRTQVQHQLGQVIKKYSRNRYIMTCRTQVMQRIPDGFTAVEVADFNVDQVQEFVCKWFRTNGRNEVEIEAQWKKFELTINRNIALKELTVTPVLLGLMCLVLQDEGGIPAKASSLYERGISLLLRKWNDDKAIEGWEIGTKVYQDLDVTKKEKLLIDIAARKFENPENFVLFEQSDLVEQISQYLNFSDRNDAWAVLKAIESQHGLLVERADGLWSFSHLTFQEYFTTKWLLNLHSEELSRKIANKRWQEIVQQLIKAQGHSDRLLRLIKKAIDYSIADDKKLQNFIVWILAKATSITASNNLAGIRLFYVAMASSLDLDLDRDLDHDRDRDLARNLARTRDLDLDLDHARELAIDRDLTLTLDRDRALKLNPNLDLDLELGNALALALARALARAGDPKFANELKHLRAVLLRGAQANHFRKWWKLNGQTWRESLREIMVKYRNIGHDWQFTNVQEQQLQHYYNGNKFLISLLKSSSYDAVSPEARKEIEDNLLLPIAELKRRLPEQYGGIEES